MILTALLRLEVDDVRHVAVAGDTASDLIAGSRAGAGVVAGVLTGAHARAELGAGAAHPHHRQHHGLSGAPPRLVANSSPGRAPN